MRVLVCISLMILTSCTVTPQELTRCKKVCKPYKGLDFVYNYGYTKCRCKNGMDIDQEQINWSK